MTYGGENRLLLADVGLKFERAEMELELELPNMFS